MQTHIPIKNYRRYHAYDYSRGAVEFISFNLDDRRFPIFGTISPTGSMQLSKAGEILEKVILFEADRPSPIELKRHVVMPEHLHLRVYIHPNQPKPLKVLGQFISNIKRWSMKKCSEIGVQFSWQKNYHDRLCLTREIIDRVDKYIELNPIKWALMHSANPPMKVIEPLYSPLIPNHEWWAGVGNVRLVSGEMPLCAIRLSRHHSQLDSQHVISMIISKCLKGMIPISTFISPLERELYYHLAQLGIPMICAIPDPLTSIYRPTVEQTRLFAQNNLLLLSLLQSTEITREKAWHNINEAISQLAYASNGEALYLR